MTAFDHTDAEFTEIMNAGLALKFDQPAMAELRDLILEFMLRVREMRHHTLTKAVEHNGHMWVRADEILNMLDGGNTKKRR